MSGEGIIFLSFGGFGFGAIFFGHTGSTKPLLAILQYFGWFNGGGEVATFLPVGRQRASRPRFSSLTRSADVLGLRPLTDVFIPGLIQASAAGFLLEIWRLRENTAMI